MSFNTRKQILKTFPSARSVSKKDLQRLIDLCELYCYNPKEIIFQQNSPSTSIHLVIDGKVSIQTESDGQKILLSLLNPGVIIGEMGLLDGTPRSATAVASSSVTTLSLSYETYNLLSQKNDPIALWLLDIIAEDLAKRIRSMTFKVAEARSRPDLKSVTQEQRSWFSFITKRIL